MVKAKNKNKRRYATELDGVYVLKIVLYLITGAQWVWLTNPAMTKQIPVPIGLMIGGLFAMHDHFQIDRKIEFAILLVAAFMGYWSQTGLLVTVLK